MQKYNFNYRIAEDRLEREQLLAAIYRLRYQVYVNEWGFEKAADHPGELEQDRFDLNSRHFYACTLAGDEIIGTARLILPSPAAGCMLPIQEHFEFDDQVCRDPSCKVAEVSRLAISKEFRRRAIDRVIFSKDRGHVEELERHDLAMRSLERERRKCEHELVRGLYLMIYHDSIRLGLTHWYAVMARGLYVMLRRWGINFEQIGPEKLYHGIRAPYLLSIRALEKDLQRENPELLDLARSGFA